MISLMKSTAMTALALVALSAATPASADRRGDIAAGILGGVAVGAIVGSASAGPRPVYVVPQGYHGEHCGWLRDEAHEALDHHVLERASRKWDEYRDCQAH